MTPAVNPDGSVPADILKPVSKQNEYKNAPFAVVVMSPLAADAAAVPVIEFPSAGVPLVDPPTTSNAIVRFAAALSVPVTVQGDAPLVTLPENDAVRAPLFVLVEFTVIDEIHALATEESVIVPDLQCIAPTITSPVAALAVAAPDAA